MRIDGRWFKDEQGRTLILRGANLGGSSKVPYPDGATHVREGFFDHRDVSFVGRPFPLGETGEHLSRLKAWGLNFLRLLVTWEAIEHGGPGHYDLDYLDHLVEVVRRAGEHGLTVVIDPHQDVWSRFSGGDGAPGWTFEVAGLDITHFQATGAAIVHATHGDPFPRMIWPTNYDKLAAATMFTLFFGGDRFAPRARVDGEPVQSYLQRHYLAAMRQVAHRLAGLSHVAGYDTMNEPSAGYIGWADLRAHPGPLRLGESPTPFQAMCLGAGLAQDVEVWGLGLTGLRKRGQVRIDPAGARAWLDGCADIWQQNGVWEVADDGVPHLLRPDHFVRAGGGDVDFVEDHLRPFLEHYAREIRSVDPDAVIFLEAPPTGRSPRWDLARYPRVAHAAHWYDALTLMTKRYLPFLGIDSRRGRLVLGRRRVRRSFAAQLAAIQAETEETMGQVPVLLGEFGIPFDLGGGRAYRTGDFSRQVAAMDDTFQALDANLMSGTVWNYTPDNDNVRGDGWNGEDLSIFSRDQQHDPTDIDSGGRALASVVRPYARATAGEPLSMSYDPRTRAFEFTFRHDPAVTAPTEMYVPEVHYPAGYSVEVSDGECTADHDSQTMIYRHSHRQPIHHVRIRPS